MAKVVKKCIVPGVLQVDSGRTKRRVDTETAWKAHRCISCVCVGNNEYGAPVIAGFEIVDKDEENLINTVVKVVELY